MVRNHYLLLGIPPDASQRQIKKVYRGLAKRFHPDRNKGSEAAAELFRQVTQAYRVLSDPVARARYDKQLAKQQAQAPPVQPSSASEDKHSQQKFGKFINSLLDALFGPMLQPEVQKRGAVHVAPDPRQAVKRPDFNFYYHLATEKKGAEYDRGRDGVYRRVNKRKKHASRKHL